jgi:hypothetical protein
MLQRDDEIASLQCELLRRSQAQESAAEGVLKRLSRLEADGAVVGSLSTEVARVKELQSVLGGEVEKVRQQLREAKETADSAKDIGFASRAVAEEAQKHVAEVRSEVETQHNALREVRELAEGAQTKAASTEVHLGRVGRLEAEVWALKTRPVDEIRSEVDHLRMALREVRELAEPVGWNSAILPDFPKLFERFKKKQFTLLWRGSRDGFGCGDFHGCCDGHPNILTVILDTKGNIFGGFTPVEWESSWTDKADPSLKSFLFTLKNPHNFPARKFVLKAEKNKEAICCYSNWGPHFSDIGVYNSCNATNDSFSFSFGRTYRNDTGLDGKTFFTGSSRFQVREIEVFELTD